MMQKIKLPILLNSEVEKREGYIKVNDVNLFYEFLNKDLLAEEKPLLVFLHEGLGSVEQWKNFPAQLSEKVKCPALIFDREGYGKSGALKSLRDRNYLHIQAQLALPEIFLKLGIDNCKKILIGHSDGGSIAIIHAGTFPEKIIGIITEASHQFIENISVEGIREAVKLYKEGRLKDLLTKYHGEKTDSIFYGWADTWLLEGFQQWNIEEFLKKIDIPFLAIQGKEDQYGSFAQLESIKRNVPKSDICYVPECGHTPHLQHKEKILQIMSDFIIRHI
jgi:pimeloyl-ACP methyl ester carboxylesterase